MAYQDDRAGYRADRETDELARKGDARRVAESLEFNIVGQRLPLVDAVEKVTGQGVYTDDIKLPGMAVGKILRSPHPHARILSIDTSRAEAMPGVFAIVTGDEHPRTFGVLPISRDETMLAVGKVRHVGEGVVAVAARDEATAVAALAAVDVEYEVLKPFLKARDSVRDLRPGEEKIHPHTRKDNNIHKMVKQHFGDVDAAFAEAEAVRTVSHSFKPVTHAFTEPHCVVAREEAGRLCVWSAQQVPHYLHQALASVLERPMHSIQVIKPLVGGGFGGKSDPFPHEIACAALALKCGRPVKLLFDREESFISNHGRHGTDNTVTMAIAKDGTLLGTEVEAVIDGGAFGSFGVVTTYYNGVLSHGPYRLNNFRYKGTRVYTNKPVCGAMRGHGSVNTRHATETLLDDLAEAIGMDPIEVRLKNVLPEYTETANGFRITSNGIRECIERVRDASGWVDKHGKLPYGHGIGIGCGFYISGSALRIHDNELPHSTVHLKVDADYGITLHSMAADIGQGSDTMLAQCTAEVLGCEMERIRVKAKDTDTAPIDLGSYSSRVTFMAGNAARKAAEDLLGQLTTAASQLTGYPAEAFVARAGMLYNMHWPDRSVPLEEAMKKAMARKGALIARGAYDAPPMGRQDFKGAGAGLSPTYSFSAFVAELKVDPETGIIQPVEFWAAHDCGRALNPIAVEGQLEGSIHMGLGQALMEDFDQSHGQIVNANFLDYKCLTPNQMPKLNILLVESVDPEGPFGAKECGEGGLAPVLPAIGNALYDAVGVRPRKMPFTPDVVYNALQQERRRKAKSSDAA